MNVHDSPMEAVVAFNPVNLGPLLTAAVNNIWAWFALVTASALNFCRARPTITSTPSLVDSKDKDEGRPQTTPSHESTRITSAPTLGGSNKKEEEEGALTRGNSSKELFTVCFKEETENESQTQKGYFDHDDQEEEELVMDGGDEGVVKRWKVEMRGRGDLGWYGYQDMKVIDGSVVRLWEEERERCSPRSYRRRYSVVATPMY